MFNLISRNKDNNFNEDVKKYLKLNLEKTLKESVKTMGITGVYVKKNKNSVNIKLTSESPGKLIGKGGEVIKKVSFTLSKQFDSDFSLTIKQSDLWK